MADPQSSAPSRACAGAPTSGVIHVRTRLTAEFTVLANALAQRPGSAVTVGVAAYVASLPDGAPVSIAALCAHFTEGEILISRALRELEAAGYLERRRERGPGGRIRTRTYFHDVPNRGGPVPAPAPRPEAAPVAAPAPVPVPEPAAAPRSAPPPPSPSPPREPSPAPLSLADADPRAVAILASLRTRDPRLILSGDDALGGILAYYSTHHTPPELLPVVFAEFHRTLAPGGCLMLAGYVGDGERLRPSQAYGGHPVSYESYLVPTDRIIELLGRAGLTVTARLVQEPGEGMRRTIATFLARKPERS